MDESEIKTSRFGHVSGDVESRIKVGTLNPKTFESGELILVTYKITVLFLHYSHLFFPLNIIFSQ